MTKNKEKKGRIKKDNVTILILTVILVILLISIGVMTANIFKKDKVEVKEVKIVDNIKNYGYSVTENNTEYYKKLFGELKEILKQDEVNEEEYAKKIAQLFVADFYDLNSKQSKNDVGGTQFVYASYKETFLKFATDSNGIYYYVQSNLYEDRKQTLPIVTEVTVTSANKVSYNYNTLRDEEAYRVTLGVNYKTNLGYPKVVTVTLVHNEDKLEVVEMK